MVVPDRSTVLQDASDGIADGVAGAGAVLRRSGIEDLVIDPSAGLRARLEIAETISPNGSCWTDYGAYSASRDVIEALREAMDVSPVPESSLEFWEQTEVGDLGPNSDGGAEPEPRPVVQVLHRGQDSYRRVQGRSNKAGGAVQTFQNRDPSLPKLIAFAGRGRPSAALTRMLPFLAPRFGRVVVVTAPHLFADLVESERPDAVVHLIDEAGLAEAPSGVRRDFEKWSGQLLPLQTSAPALTIDFSAAGNARERLGEGWSNAESPHTWSLGAQSTLSIADLPGVGAHDAVLDVSPCLAPPNIVEQRLEIDANGTTVASFDVAAQVRLAFHIPASAMRGATTLTLRFRHPGFVDPAALGWSHDDRLLAICFKKLELAPSGYA